MPASVAIAAPSTVLPQFLCRAFSHSREYVVEQNDYVNGGRQTRLLTTSSRKSWRMDAAVSSTILTSLSAFYLARKGPLQPFYFYDLTLTTTVYDATGALTAGRHVVHFSREYRQDLVIGKSSAAIELTELA